MDVKRYLDRDLPARLGRLAEPALAARSSWGHASDAPWRTIDAEV